MCASSRSRRAVAASMAAMQSSSTNIMMDRLLELETCQPPPMQQRPGRSVVVVAVAQQEAGQLLTGLSQSAHRRLTRTDEIADRLVDLIGHPDRGQFTGAVQPAEVDRVSSVSLDPLARLARDQRWGNHGTVVSHSSKLPLNALAAWSGLITKPQFSSRMRKLHGQSLQGSRRIGDLPMLAHFSPQARFSQRDRYRILVHVKADIGDRLRHDPSPYA
jgi:hypothetical protein